jgi:hypothetical protein
LDTTRTDRNSVNRNVGHGDISNMKATVLIILAVLVAGCAHLSTGNEGHHYYRAVSFPKVDLKTDNGERIDSVEVIMHCGRFTAINRIPNDWSAQVVSPVSEETTLTMEAGHGTADLWHSENLNDFITVLVCEPSCFDITASLRASYYDGEMHERTISFKQTELIMKPLPNK